MRIKPRYYFYSIFLLCFLLLSGISAAVVTSASSSENYEEVISTITAEGRCYYSENYQATVTATWEPLYKTPTSAPTNDYTCPGELPIGWGTVTPNPNWVWSCNNCLLTLTPQTTMTPWGTVSPTVTVTPGNTPSPTSTKWGNFVTLGRATSVTGSPYVILDSSNITCTVPDGVAFVNASCDGTITCHSTNQYVGGDCRLYVSVNNPNTLEARVYYSQTGGEWTQFNSSEYLPTPNNSYTNIVYLNTKFWRIGGTIAPNETATFTGHFELSLMPIPVVSPTVTPSPTGTPVNSFCSVIQGDTSDFDDILPIIIVGEASCIDIDGFVIDLSWIPDFQFEEITFPSVHFCARPISFGEIKIFGLIIDLDILSTIITAAMALRWLMRS